MPESLYKEFSPEQLRDLFSFLQNDPGRAEVPHDQDGSVGLIRLGCLLSLMACPRR